MSDLIYSYGCIKPTRKEARKVAKAINGTYIKVKLQNGSKKYGFQVLTWSQYYAAKAIRKGR